MKDGENDDDEDRILLDEGSTSGSTWLLLCRGGIDVCKIVDIGELCRVCTSLLKFNLLLSDLTCDIHVYRPVSSSRYFMKYEHV